MPHPDTQGRPELTVTITGDVADFGRVDNAFAAFRREAQKLLENWKIVLDLKYEEKSG